MNQFFYDDPRDPGSWLLGFEYDAECGAICMYDTIDVTLEYWDYSPYADERWDDHWDDSSDHVPHNCRCDECLEDMVK